LQDDEAALKFSWTPVRILLQQGAGHTYSARSRPYRRWGSWSRV